MLAIVLDAIEHTARPLRQHPIDAIDEQLRITEDRVQWGPELVAHIGEELRFVLAGERQLLALVGDLAEQACVLDRQYRLARQGLHELDRFGSKLAGGAPLQDQRPENALGADERNDQDPSNSRAPAP